MATGRLAAEAAREFGRGLAAGALSAVDGGWHLVAHAATVTGVGGDAEAR